ncbi:hypothetical protein HA402_011726 [Bradysia odoriphaga]|nr:hypothetical protein HA402_011726 [Bradysia odoriphaga]
MDDDQQFCLRWNNHQSTLISVFDTLLENGTLVDCTLAAEGKFLKAHKVVLSACSPYFAALLSQQYDKHPIFILKDIKFQELRAMMDYMYRGEVNISQDQLAALLKAAESLQIKGLSESRGGSTQKNENVVQKQPVPVVSKSGLTIEHKRPANKHPTSAATESDVSMSREGSTSPTSRKRKKFRRRSIEVNNMDNHDQLSNSSSQSQSIHMTSIPMTAASQITSATSAANVLNVTKKTDHHDSKKDMEQSQADDDEDDDKNDLEPPAQRQKHDMDVSHIKEKMQSTHSELLIEPKNEYDDGQDETVEDLTLDDEELLEDLDQAGPSHGGEGSSQGYAQWQVGQNQDEVFLAAQEAAGQHRDAQDDIIYEERLDEDIDEQVETFHPIFFEVKHDNHSTTACIKTEKKVSANKMANNSMENLVLSCDCGKVYRNEASFRFHKYECGKSFECPYCNYVGKRNTTLRKHIKARHDRLYSFSVKDEVQH